MLSLGIRSIRSFVSHASNRRDLGKRKGKKLARARHEEHLVYEENCECAISGSMNCISRNSSAVLLNMHFGWLTRKLPREGWEA